LILKGLAWPDPSPAAFPQADPVVLSASKTNGLSPLGLQNFNNLSKNHAYNPKKHIVLFLMDFSV